MIATPIATNAAALSSETLHKGLTDSAVKPLQIELKKLNYYHYHIDGDFGRLTNQAVKEFQKDHSLSVNGIVDANTRQTLSKVKELEHTYQNAPLLKRGSHGSIVKDLQEQLKNLNYYNGHIDGIFGPRTENAVKEFQKANDLAVDGIAGPHTYSALIHNPVQDDQEKSTVHKNNTVSKSKSSKTTLESVSTKPAKTTTTASSKTQDKGSVKTLYLESTAYTARCAGCSGITATGINLIQNPGAKVIAVDPNIIPLGSKVWVQGYGYAVAGDTGGAINGDRIDVFMPSHLQAMQWGRRRVEVKIID